jgi:hypothetical protein
MSWFERRFLWVWIAVLLLSGCEKHQRLVIDQAGIPAYPTIHETRTTTSDIQAFSTPDSPSAVRQFYDTTLTQSGWTFFRAESETKFEYMRIDRVDQSMGYGRTLFITIEPCTSTETCVTIHLVAMTMTDAEW